MEMIQNSLQKLQEENVQLELHIFNTSRKETNKGRPCRTHFKLKEKRYNLKKQKSINKNINSSTKNIVKNTKKTKTVKARIPATRKTNVKKSNNNKTKFHQLSITCDVDTLRTLIRKKSVRVVDVRRPDDYKKGHIPTAVSLPLATVLANDTPEGIIKILQNLGISNLMPVVIYDDTFGALAARVAWTFQYIGHTNTALLEVTFSKWKSIGLEVERKINKFPATKHSISLNNNIHADASYVENISILPKQDLQNNVGIDLHVNSNTAQSKSPDTSITNPLNNKIIIDSRERLNFLTEHIPTAKNIPYTMLGTDTSILREGKELKRFMENRGISPDSEIITYCGSVGTLSGLAYYAFKLAGFNNVRLYSKSFKDWKSLGKPKQEFKEANYWDLSAE